MRRRRRDFSPLERGGRGRAGELPTAFARTLAALTSGRHGQGTLRQATCRSKCVTSRFFANDYNATEDWVVDADGKFLGTVSKSTIFDRYRSELIVQTADRGE